MTIHEGQISGCIRKSQTKLNQLQHVNVAPQCLIVKLSLVLERTDWAGNLNDIINVFRITRLSKRTTPGNSVSIAMYGYLRTTSLTRAHSSSKLCAQTSRMRKLAALRAAVIISVEFTCIMKKNVSVLRSATLIFATVI